MPNISKMMQFLIIGFLGVFLLLLGFFQEKLTIKFFILIIAAIVGAGIMAMPYKWAIRFMFVYVGFHGFLKVATNRHPVVHVGIDLLSVAICAKALFLFLARGQSIPKKLPPLTMNFLFVFFWFFICIANPYALSFAASLAGAKLYVTMPILYFFGYYITQSDVDIRRFMYPWMFVVIVHVSVSFYQFYHGPASVLALSQNYAPLLYKFKDFAFRPVGLTHAPGGGGIFVFMTVSFFVTMMIYTKYHLLRLFLLICVVSFPLLLIMCQFKSAIMKTIFSLAIMLFFYLFRIRSLPALIRKRIVTIVTSIALVLTFGIPYGISKFSEGNSDIANALKHSMYAFNLAHMAEARGGAWYRFKAYFFQAPLGAGLSRVGSAAGVFVKENQNNPYFKDLFTDNLFLALLIDLGAPGMMLFLLLIVLIAYHGFRNAFKIQNTTLFGLHCAIYGTLAVIFIGGYGAEGILYNPEASFFWFFSGVMMKIPVIDQELQMNSVSQEELNAVDQQDQNDQQAMSDKAVFSTSNV